MTDPFGRVSCRPPEPRDTHQRRHILAALNAPEDVIFFEPACFDTAIVGLTEQFPLRVVYGYQDLIELWMQFTGNTYEHAREYVDTHIVQQGKDNPRWPVVMSPLRHLPSV